MKDIKLLFFVLALFPFSNVNAQKISINVHLSQQSNRPNLLNFEDFFFQIKIDVIKDKFKKIAVPHCLINAYASEEYDSTVHNAIWTVEKLQGNKYSSFGLISNNHVSEQPCIDSLGNEWFDTLSVNRPLRYQNNLFGFYNFNQGKFRVRVTFIFYDQVYTKKENIFSNWVYFTFE